MIRILALSALLALAACSEVPNHVQGNEMKDNSIELPPLLPHPRNQAAGKVWTEPEKEVIRRWGHAAIEADRKRRGEPYNYKRIGWELERTAMGDGFYGNALRVAKDIPGVSAENRSVLDRYATGTQQGTDHIVLQNIARNIYMTPQPADHSGASTLHNEDSGAQNGNQAPQPAESAKTDDICQECGGDGAGGEHEDDCSQGEPVAWWKMHDGKPSIVPASTFLAEDAIDLGWRPLGFQDSPQHAERQRRGEPGVSTTQVLITLGKVIAGYRPGEEGWSEYDQQAYDAALPALQPAEPVKVPGDDEIREVLLSHGYKIKPGHDDLKPYVYAAAHELLDRYGNVSKSSEKIDTSAERVDDVDMGQHPTR